MYFIVHRITDTNEPDFGELTLNDLRFFSFLDTERYINSVYSRRPELTDDIFVIDTHTMRTWELASDDDHASLYLAPIRHSRSTN